MSESQNIPDATSPSETQTNSLKRKRQLLPLGTPLPQLVGPNEMSVYKTTQ